MEEFTIGSLKQKRVFWLFLIILLHVVYIAPSAFAAPVSIIGSWTSGATHAKESGVNRALIFTAHAEGNISSSLPSLISVTYGGQSMTKVLDVVNSSGQTRTYTAAFILNDDGITAATNTTFVPVWSGTTTGIGYGSAFLQNVNQTTLTGATASTTTTNGSTITTSALATAAGDMVVDAATCSSTGSYTVNNFFTEALELTVSAADGVDGYKSATGVSETPSVTHSTANNRQSLIGFVVKVAQVNVPNVVGMTQSAATTAISGAGLVVGTVANQYSDAVAAGLVISQNPEADTAVDTGSSVDLVISLGRPVVPNVVGMTEADANAVITAIDNLTVGTVTDEYSDTVAVGLVISQNPEADMAVDTGSSVDLVVSLGKPPEPNVVRIMPLGDSITRGWYGSVYQWGYREPLYVLLTNDGYSFDFVGSKADGSFPDPNHEGHDGWRADEILNGRISDPAAGKLEYWLPAHQPDIVLLHIGTNDITAGNQNADKVNAILNVIDAYEVASGKNVTVILALIIDRVPHSSATTIYNNDVNSMAMSRIANGDHIVIVNMQNALNYATDMTDEVHPNDNGYAKMANVWFDALVGKSLVPSIVGMTKPAAISAVASVSLTVGTITQRYDDTISANLVINQSPTGGTAVNIGSAVSMVVSLGPPLCTISGRVVDANGLPLRDVKMNGLPGDPCTDADGYYSVVVNNGWSGMVTPTKYTYGFTPPSISYAGVAADQNDQNYTGRLLPLTISGIIRDLCEKPVAGVLVTVDNGGGADVTDANGCYEVMVSYNWSGIVTPTKVEYTFAPANRLYDNVVTGQTDEDYTTMSIYDLYPDCVIDCSDLGLMIQSWLASGAGDFDNNGSVDFADFARFSSKWLNGI
jgi:beta-lactam-binding protein with PASTA domain/lysophospholipase L1-like esterase